MASQRLTFIDILRGIACVWMIETHAVNAFLNDEFTEGMLFGALKISNGFVAVIFIFAQELASDLLWSRNYKIIFPLEHLFGTM